MVTCTTTEGKMRNREAQVNDEHAKQATTWAALTLQRHGCTLHATDCGWDVEGPDGSWVAANDWRELCRAAHSALHHV
jgi:hypothetical protein